MTNQSRDIRNGVTSRLLRVYRQLFVDGKVRGKTAFCESVGICQQNFVSLERGTLFCTIENAYLLHTVWGVSLDWLFTNEGEMFV